MNEKKVIRGPRAGSRKAIMQALELGESVVFMGEPGASLQGLQASVNATFRQPETFGGQGLSQTGGLLVFEGEVPVPVTRVTRIFEV